MMETMAVTGVMEVTVEMMLMTKTRVTEIVTVIASALDAQTLHELGREQWSVDNALWRLGIYARRERAALEFPAAQAEKRERWSQDIMDGPS